MSSFKAILFLALFTFLCTSGRAQNAALQSNTFSITGTLAFPDGHRPGGNVMVLNSQDSSLLTGDFFLDGEVKVVGIDENEVLLRFTSLEFADVYHRVVNHGQIAIDFGLITIQPAALALDAIVVRGRKPVYTQRPDGTVEVLVANTVLAASTSTTEILARTPDVQIDEDGLLSVLGKGAATLYLDGQPITAEQLALVAPANVSKIAVIRNPSARYDASGGAVIEITTLRGREDGYRIGLQQNTGYSAFGGGQSYSGINLSGNKGRFAGQANYAVQLGEDRNVKFTTRDRTDPAIFLSSAVNIDWQRKLNGYHYYGLGLQYDAPGGGAISLGYTGATEQLGGNTFNTNRLIDDEGVLDYASTISMQERDRSNAISLNYNKELDSLGSGIFIGGQYVGFANTANNPILENGITPTGPTQRQLLNLLVLGIDVTSLQLDYTKVLSTGHRFEAGLRYGQVINNADLDFFIAEAGEDFLPSEELSSIYIYNEQVSAGYLNMSGRLSDRIQYTAGLRTEQTNYTLSLKEEDEAPLSDNYLNLFPNAGLTLFLPENRTLNLSYTSRIRRPPYQSLNPNLIYQDPYTSIQGNPELIPEKI
ncbi:MAG: TonB-dependent receptor, partial [Lewinella sp.]